MKPIIDIDSKLDDIIEYWDFSPLQDEDSRIERLKTEFKSLIREVAKEALPEPKPIVKGTANDDYDWYLGYNDCTSEQRTKLNKLLGKEKQMSSLGDEATSLIDGSIAEMSSWLDDKEDEYRAEINSLQDECSILQKDLYQLEKDKDSLEQEIINLNVVIQNMKDGYDEDGEKI